MAPLSRNFLLALLFSAGTFTAKAQATASVPAALPLVEAGPPNSNNGIAFRELFEMPEQWAQTRSKTNELLYADWAFKQFSDDDLKKWFAQMRQWNMKLELEVGAVKPWGKTGLHTFEVERSQWDRIVALGGQIDSIAMDEPLTTVRGAMHLPDDYAATETANFIAQVRQSFPQTSVIEIEPYPYIPLEDQKNWIAALQKKLADMNVKPLDGYRLDVNWIEFNLQQHGSWKEVKQIEDYCRSIQLPFSLIYWSAGFDHFKRLHVGDDSTWYHQVMEMGYAYAAIDGKPDQYCIESWVNAPEHSIPETDMSDFTRSVNDFSDKFVRKSP